MAILAVMPTIPERATCAASTVARLLPQVDTLVIYLNGHDAIPTWATHPKIRAVRRAAGTGPAIRFSVPAWMIHRADLVLFVDDDLEYPRDYAKVAREDLRRLGPGVIVAYHGSIWPADALPSYRFRRTIPFFAASDRDQRITYFGSGTLAVQSQDLLRVRERVVPLDFAREDDVWFSAAAARAGLKGIRPRTPADFIREQPAAGAGLFASAGADGFRKRDAAISRVRRLGGWSLS